MVWMRSLVLVAVLGVAGVVTFGAPAQTHAFSLTMSDGVNPAITVNDNNVPLGTGIDFSPVTGVILFQGSLGAFSIQLTVGTSNAPGTVKLAELTIVDLSLSTTGFSGTQTLTFTLEDAGFTLPSGTGLPMVSQLSMTNVPATTSATYQSFLDAQPGTVLNLTGVGGVQAVNTVDTGTPPFTLKSVTSLSLNGTGVGNSMSAQFTGVTAVIEWPSTASLLVGSVSVLGFGYVLRRRHSS